MSIGPALKSTKSKLVEIRASVDLVEELLKALTSQYAELQLSLPEGDPIRVFLRNLVKNYTEELEKNLDIHFLAAAPVFEAFSIFDPICLPKAEDAEFQDYGTDKVIILCDQFLRNILRKMVKEQASHRINFRSLVDAAQIYLTQPLSNAVVERGASAVKRVKTKLRSRMKNAMLSSLLQVIFVKP